MGVICYTILHLVCVVLDVLGAMRYELCALCLVLCVLLFTFGSLLVALCSMGDIFAVAL